MGLGTWFQQTAEPNFNRFLMMVAGEPNLRFLQIGVFRGDASEWMLRNVLTEKGSTLVDVDPWGFDESYTELDPLAIDWNYEFKSYKKRMEPYRDRVVVRSMDSNTFFAQEAEDPYQQELFDFIYIDGAHDPIHTLEDGVHAYRALKPGGLLAFDDYTYETEDRDPYKAPTMAIDAIRNIYKNELIPIEIGSQVWFRKAK